MDEMLVVFRCRQCSAPLSNPVQQTEWRPLPRVQGREHYTYGPSTVAKGFFSADPEPFRIGADHSTATRVINPLDGVLMRHHVDPTRLYGCCRLDGFGGANLLCARCGAEVGIEISDCWREYDVRLICSAVVEAPTAADE
jgi:hypothetical protein